MIPDMLKNRYAAVSLTGVLAIAGISSAACGAPEASSSGTSAGSRSAVVGQASERFPAQTVTDWVSFADQVSMVTAVAEKETPQPPGANDGFGEDYIGRTVTLRVDRTIWRRESAPSASDTLRVITQGWVEKNGERHPFAIAGADRIVPGRTYLIPLLRTPDGGWAALSPGSIMRLRPGGTARLTPFAGGSSGAGGHNSAAESLTGMTTGQITEILNNARPHPAAVKHADLSPDDRVRKVQKAEG